MLFSANRFFEDNRSYYMIMDIAPKGELYKAVAASGGVVSEEVCRRYILQIALAVLHMHQRGVMHRDIKPENVLIGADGTLKLADFGSVAFAETVSNELVQLQFTQCGTPEYIR
jgi:NIMA (never in mitosis gene a)-related kinase 1/4/5